MAYVNIAGGDHVKDSRSVLLDRDEELRRCFAATAFPTSPAPLLGQLCYRTDQGIWYGCSDATTPVWEPIGTDLFLLLTGGALLGKIGFAKADAIATATTLDLDAVDGNLVHATGATTITGVTLAEGHAVFVIFDGAPAITLGANLRGPPTNNTGTLQMAAGDAVLFVGDGSGVTRIVFHSPISGYALASGARAFAAAPLVTGQGRLMRPASGTHADSGKLSWGSSAPPTLAEGEVYLRHA